MKKLSAVFIVIVCLCSHSSAMSDVSPQDSVGINGVAWNNLNKLDNAYSCKELYLRGFFEGVACGGGSEDKKILWTVSYKHMIESLDQFYSDYRNINIFFYNALMIITMEIRGNDKDVVDSVLRKSRKLSQDAFEERKNELQSQS